MNILDIIKGWLGMATAPPRAPEHLALPEPHSPGGAEVENLRTASFSELDAREVEAPPPAPPPANDLVRVRTEAGVDAVTQNRVLRAKQLLETLPTGTPKAQKRAIVEAAFVAFDIPTAKIIQGAVDEVAALEAYIERGEQEKDETLARCEERIRALEAQIASVRDEMQRAREAQAERDRVARAEIATIHPILLFFADEAASVRPSVPPAPLTRPRVGKSSMPPALPEATPMRTGLVGVRASAPPVPPPPPDSADLVEASDIETAVGPHPLSLMPVPVPSTARESGKAVEGEGEEPKSPTKRPSRVPPPAR